MSESYEKKVSVHEKWIDAVFGKLIAEGVTKKNYDNGKARMILSKGVMPRLLVDTLTEHESEIKEQLP